MVLDKYVCQMAYEGDIGAVKAWLAADPSRDVTDLSFWEGETQRFSADDCLSAVERLPGFLDSHLAQNEAFVETKALIAGVRACGSSWTSYCRLPHKELLRLRSLILRGRARPRREPTTARRVAAHRSITFLLCKLGDNGVVWKILEFWQATR